MSAKPKRRRLTRNFGSMLRLYRALVDTRCGLTIGEVAEVLGARSRSSAQRALRELRTEVGLTTINGRAPGWDSRLPTRYLIDDRAAFFAGVA